MPSSDGALATQTVKEFVMNVAARSPAPGGGSVSALLGALVLIPNMFLNPFLTEERKVVPGKRHIEC